MIYSAEKVLLLKKISNILKISEGVSIILGFFIHPIFFGIFVALLVTQKTVKRKLSNWEKGFIGEYNVIEEFSKVKNINGVLLSDVLLPGQWGNIDHVLICERGIFAIETKAYTSAYVVLRDEWYLETDSDNPVRVKSVSKVAKRNAAILAEFIQKECKKSYFVVPLIIFSSYGVVEGVLSVPVLYPWQVEDYVSRFPRVLSREEIKCLEKLLSPYASHVMDVGTENGVYTTPH